jgi:hypothetical protein
MAHRADTGGQMHSQADETTAQRQRACCVKAHANEALGYAKPSKPPLRIDRGLERVKRIAESDEECIALRVNFSPVGAFNGRAHDATMAYEQSRVTGVAQRPQELRRAFDIGEKESRRPAMLFRSLNAAIDYRAIVYLRQSLGTEKHCQAQSGASLIYLKPPVLRLITNSQASSPQCSSVPRVGAARTSTCAKRLHQIGVPIIEVVLQAEKMLGSTEAEARRIMRRIAAARGLHEKLSASRELWALDEALVALAN